ncbi:hypothetical protein BDA99DRAFT_557037 [Phascolomyces articulosus]|uniref:BTB domain-containing protein n=1 Tax=Phascolomyces articulosus TaxID=60185 RepID=A0AAD5PIU3_9FUNG|nr:hypothetical protein BDA99DRAFT_557037 [Phascolomyces articulosus]
MVQDMPTPVMTSKEHYKSNQIYMNGINGSTVGSPTTTSTITTTAPTVGLQQQRLINTNNESSPAAMHQMPIPIAVPMPMLAPMTHHHAHHPPHPPPQPPQQPFFPSMGPPAMTAPAVVTAAAAAQAPPVTGGPPPPHQSQHQQSTTTATSLYNNTHPTLDQSYCDYLYHVGFLQGLFSDITVNVPAVQKSYALHSLILTRSPLLYRRLLSLGVHHHQQQHPLVMDLDIVVSPETVHTIIGHLYRPLTQQDLFFIVNENPQICFELLDATQELELEALQNQLLNTLGRSFTQNTVFYWISALLSTSQHYPSPTSTHPQQRQRLWTDLLDQQIVRYLISGLPRQLTAQSPSPSSCDESDDVNFGTCVQVADPTEGKLGSWQDTIDEWARVYSELPLEYLKRCLEHNELLVKDTVERYKFANRVLYFREQLGKNGLTVLLQFSGGDYCGVLIVKKQASKFGKWDPSQF